MSFKSKLSMALAAALCALALSVGTAKADTITTFDVSGTFAGGAGGTLSGTITIDLTRLSPPIANTPTTDVFLAADISYSGAINPPVGPFTNTGLQEFCGCFGQFFVGDINTNQLSIIYSIPPPPNLYVGGPIPTDSSTYAMYLAVLPRLPTGLAAALLQSPAPSSAPDFLA